MFTKTPGNFLTFIISVQDKKIHMANKSYFTKIKRRYDIPSSISRNFDEYSDVMTMLTASLYEKGLEKKANKHKMFLIDNILKLPKNISDWILEYKEFIDIIKNNVSVSYLSNTVGTKIDLSKEENINKLKTYFKNDKINTKTVNLDAKFEALVIHLQGTVNQIEDLLNEMSKKFEENQNSLDNIEFELNNVFAVYKEHMYSFLSKKDFYIINEKYQKLFKKDPIIDKIIPYFRWVDKTIDRPKYVSFKNLKEVVKKFNGVITLAKNTSISLNFLNYDGLKTLLKNYGTKELTQKIISAIKNNKIYFKHNSNFYIMDLVDLSNHQDEFIDLVASSSAKEFLLHIKNDCKKNYNKESNVNLIEKKLKDLKFNATLYKHQLEGVSFIKCLYDNKIGGGILADSMGAGKSVQTIGFLSLIEPNKKILIVAPASVVGNWEAEINKFYPKLFKVQNVTITSYEKLLSLPISKVDVLILDEAQKIKNSKTQMFNKIDNIEKKFTLIVTGTPIENKVDDLFSYLHLIHPGAFQLLNLFKKIHHQNVIAKKIRNIIEPIYLQRKVTEELVKGKLNIHEKFIDPSKLELALQDEIKKVFRDELIKAEAENNHDFYSISIMLTGLMRMRQALSYPEQLPPELLNHFSKNLQQAIKGSIPSKFKELEKIYKDVQSRNEKIVIFAQFTETIKFLKRSLESKGAKCLVITGSTSSSDRTRYVNEFQNNDAYDVFIISLKAGNSGITLHRANNVVIYDLWFNPQVIAQAIARVHRIGQDYDVNAYFLIIKNTVDQRIYDIIYKKKNIINSFENPDNVNDKNAQQEVLDIASDMFGFTTNKTKKDLKLAKEKLEKKIEKKTVIQTPKNVKKQFEIHESNENTNENSNEISFKNIKLNDSIFTII